MSIRYCSGYWNMKLACSFYHNYKTVLLCGLLTIIRCFCPTALIFAFLHRNGRHWYTSTTSRIKVWGQKFHQGVIIITMVQFTLENNHEKESSGHCESSVSLTIKTWAHVLSYEVPRRGSRILKWGVNFHHLNQRNQRNQILFQYLRDKKKKKERRGLRKRGVKIHPFHLPWICAWCP